MLLDPRKVVVGAQQDEREAFVVAQQHVVGGPEALDQLRLEQQRLGFVIGRDDRHRPRLRDHPLQPLGQPLDLRVIGDAVLERARLADIEHVAARILHAIDARSRGQGLQHIADRRHAGGKVGRLTTAADGVGGFVFVESGRRIGVGHARRI